MKESKFIEQNKEKWVKFEQLLSSDSKDPDKLSDFFIKITDDLSYARTFYNNRSIRLYLNNICQQLFYLIYKSPKKRRFSSFTDFWKTELPLIAYQARGELLTALIVFVLAVAIGVISSINDPEFVRVILGNEYVDMTIANIESGDPMAVYKKMNEVDMVLGITLNNLIVAVKTFLMGILWAAGSIIILLYNGIMVGAFQYFFVEQGLFAESFLTIWLHGTLEMSAFVIAAAGGILLGKGIIAPGSYTRVQSFQMAAKKGAKLFLGIAPIIVFAAIIESFITRYTEAPDILRLTLILISLASILFYYVWYPRTLANKGLTLDDQEGLQASPDFDIKCEGIIKSGVEILRDTFLFYRKYGNRILKVNLIASLIYLPIAVFVVLPTITSGSFSHNYQDWFLSFASLFNYESHPELLILNPLLFAIHSFFIAKIFYEDVSGNKISSRGRKIYFSYFLFSILMNLILFSTFFIGPGWELLISFLVSPLLMISLFVIVFEGVEGIKNPINRAWALLKGNYGFIYGLSIIVLLITTLGYLFLTSPFPLFYVEFIQWNIPISNETLEIVLITLSTFTSIFTTLLAAPLYMISMYLAYFTCKEINEAHGLRSQLEAFGK
jgi:uncharacterized membrane protein SpoIIM required for sporulation